MAKRIDEDYARAPESWVFTETLWRISPGSFRAWVMMTAFAAAKREREDGFISTFNARRNAELTDEQETELIAAGLLVTADDGFILRTHTGAEWTTLQYSIQEREDDRKRYADMGQKGGKARAEKAAAKASVNEPWPGANEAFEGCFDTFRGQFRGRKDKGRAAFFEKIPDQAASDVLFEKIKLHNAQLSDSFGGWGFVKFLDEYESYNPTVPKNGAQNGHFKVTEEHGAEYYGKPGEQDI